MYTTDKGDKLGLPVKPEKNHFKVENPSLLVFPETVDVEVTIVDSMESVEMSPVVHTDDFTKVSLVFLDIPLVVKVFVVIGLFGDGGVVTTVSATVGDGHGNVILSINKALLLLRTSLPREECRISWLSQR